MFIVILCAKIIICVQVKQEIAKKLYSNLKFIIDNDDSIIFVGYLFQNWNIQENKSTYFIFLSSSQNFHFLIDAVSLFTDFHFDVLIKYSFWLMPSKSKNRGVFKIAVFSHCFPEKKSATLENLELLIICVARKGLEPLTFGLWIRRSNQLSYLAIICTRPAGLFCKSECKGTLFFWVCKIFVDIFLFTQLSQVLNV